MQGLEKYETLDAHPLVREFFGHHLQTHHPETYQQANIFLYEYFKGIAKELPDTLEEMEPLFQAVAHGCRAGKQQEVYADVLWKRVLREGDGYLFHKLGAFGSFLACLFYFFDMVWEVPAANLTEYRKAVALSWAGYSLQALGRFAEAAQAMKASLGMAIEQNDWKGASHDTGNLCELYLTAGNVPQAVDYGKLSVKYADKSEDGNMMSAFRTTYANVLNQHGEIKEAAILFAVAEEMQKKRQPKYQYLYSLWGFHYCDLLISMGKVEEVIERAKTTLEYGKLGYSLLDIALDKLSLGKAFLQLNLPDFENPADFNTSINYLNEAVEGSRKAGNSQMIPCGLLARASYYRISKEYEKAETDLQEALEIAEYGNMNLYLVDYHLEKMRLCKAMGKEEEAAKHREEARVWIDKTGYERRRKELEEE